MAALGLLAGAEAAWAQVNINGRQNCISCSLQAQLVVRLGGQNGGDVGPTMMIGRRGDGWAILAHDQAVDEMRLFRPSGIFVRTVGRRGRGPGEFLNIRSVIVGRGDTLYVFDHGNARMTVLDRSLSVVRTMALPAISFPPAGVVLFEDGSIVVNSSIRTPERVGQPLHLISRTGQIVRSFGSTDGAFRSDVVAAGFRRVARAGPQSLLSAQWTRYLIEEWTVDGRFVRSVERRADWFRPWYRYPPMIDADTPLPPLLNAVYRDGAGLVWVAIEVPSADWKTAGRRTRTADGEQFSVDVVKSYDTMIEVLDVAKGELVFSVRVDPHILHILPTGEFVAISEDPEGTPVVELWRYRLIRGGR